MCGETGKNNNTQLVRMLTCVKMTDNWKRTKADIKLGRNESRDVYIMGGFKAHTADLSKHNRFRSRSRQRK